MRGHTIVELLLVLLLMSATAASVAPSMRRWRDRAAVVAAREAVVGLFAEARLAAVERGGATVSVSADPDQVEVHAAGTVLRALSLATDFGVEVEPSGSSTDVVLSYDALGLGRVSSQTLTFRRGGETVALVVSAYGRVRRR